MRKLIIVLGHLAAGKSTLARALSKELNAFCLMKDDLKELLGDRLGFQNREENFKLSQSSFDIMKYVLKQYANQTNPLVLESNFRDYEIVEINQLATVYEYQIHYLVLTGDPEVLYQRFVLRNPNRHIVHQSVGLVDRKKFFETLYDYSTFEFNENSIFIDATDLNTIDLPAICNQINAK